MTPLAHGVTKYLTLAEFRRPERGVGHMRRVTRNSEGGGGSTNAY